MSHLLRQQKYSRSRSQLCCNSTRVPRSSLGMQILQVLHPRNKFRSHHRPCISTVVIRSKGPLRTFCKMDHNTTTLWNRTEGEISKRKTTSKCRHPFTNTQKTLSSKNSGATKPLKMNAELYYDLVKYLEEEEIREEADEWRRRLLKNSKKQFELHGTTLFRKTKMGTRKVISEHKLSAILEVGHNHHLSGHMGADNILYRLQQQVW